MMVNPDREVFLRSSAKFDCFENKFYTVVSVFICTNILVWEDNLSNFYGIENFISLFIWSSSLIFRALILLNLLF